MLAVSSDRARPRHAPRRRGGQGASRRRRGHDAGQPAAARAGSGRQDQPVHVPASSCCRTTSVRYANQPIAVVIAETLEAATEGAALLAPRYDVEPARIGLDDGETLRAARGRRRQSGRRSRTAMSRPAWRRRRSAIEATYETPPQYHNAMEPHAIVAAWDGDTLSIDTPSQALAMAQGRLRRTVRHPAGEHPYPQPLPRRRLRLQGDLVTGPQVLGILAARLVGRPVKLVLRREQMYGPVGHRGADPPAAAPRHRRRRTADRDRPSRERRDQQLRRFLRAGRRRLAHALCQPRDRHARTRRSRLDTGTPLFMRAPGEATGSVGAGERDRRGGLRPAAWTRWRSACKNYAEVEPISGKPFSSKALRECYAQGAERFGWVEAAARAAADARRGRPARRLGHGHRDLSGADVPGRGARGAARATARR